MPEGRSDSNQPRSEGLRPPTVDGVAVRAADDILRRAADDEAAAAEARSRYRSQCVSPLEADERIEPLLRRGEWLIAVRRFVALERRTLQPPPPDAPPLGGDLYVTSQRLLLVGRHIVAFELADIGDAVVSGERLRLALRDGTDVRVDVQQPRLLRVEIAAARSAIR